MIRCGYCNAVIGDQSLAEHRDSCGWWAGHRQAPRCPDGSWGRQGRNRCKLPMGHAGHHEYEVRS